MDIVDSQVHIWAADRPDRPWVPGAKPHLPEPLGDEDLIARMDEAGVDRAILVPPGWEGDRVDYCLEAAARHPDRFAVMGYLAVQKPEARPLLETWMEPEGMLGARLLFSGEEARHWLTDGTADWFWPAAERLGIPVMVNVPFGLKEIGAIAKRHPGLTIIIDHMGIRGVKDDAIAPVIATTSSLARLPNVYVKVSLVPGFSTAPYPYRNIHRYLRQIIEAFGARRCFWGSDLSAMLTRSTCSYAQSVALFRDELDFLSAEDKAWIMGRGIAACLGWPPRPAAAAGAPE